MEKCFDSHESRAVLGLTCAIPCFAPLMRAWNVPVVAFLCPSAAAKIQPLNSSTVHSTTATRECYYNTQQQTTNAAIMPRDYSRSWKHHLELGHLEKKSHFSDYEQVTKAMSYLEESATSYCPSSFNKEVWCHCLASLSTNEDLQKCCGYSCSLGGQAG